MVEKGKEGWEEMGRNGSDREVEGGCGGRTQRDREGWAPVRSGGTLGIKWAAFSGAMLLFFQPMVFLP